MQVWKHDKIEIYEPPLQPKIGIILSACNLSTQKDVTGGGGSIPALSQPK